MKRAILGDDVLREQIRREILEEMRLHPVTTKTQLEYPEISVRRLWIAESKAEIERIGKLPTENLSKRFEHEGSEAEMMRLKSKIMSLVYCIDGDTVNTDQDKDRKLDIVKDIVGVVLKHKAGDRP